MCGRYALYGPVSRLREAFDAVPEGFEFEPRWNAAPMQWLPVVRQRSNGERVIHRLRCPSSTDDQDLTNQRAELHSRRLHQVSTPRKLLGPDVTGRSWPALLDHLRPGDVVTVTRLDRLARSTRDLLDIAERIQETGAGLRSLAEPWADTTTPAGRMVLTVFAGIAEFERSLNDRPHQERPRSGQGARREVRPPPTLSRRRSSTPAS